MVTIRRKLYRRGASYETTIPKPLLFALDPEHKKYAVEFTYDPANDRWYIAFSEEDHV